MPERDNGDEFQWDYSYFKWQDIPRDVRRQMVLDRSWAARTWINGKTTVQMDVPFAAARELYNKKLGRMPGSLEGRPQIIYWF